MNQRNKIVIILIALVVLATGGLWYGKKQLWKAQPADAIAIQQKEKNPVDLRPAAIAKLQELVLIGSDSLYKLSIDSLLTEIASGTVVLKGVSVSPDSQVLRRLHAQQRLPDDVFRLRLASLRVTGIGLDDILNRRDLHLSAIECLQPHIEVYHELKPYNAGKRKAAKEKTLFARLNAQLDKLAIDSVSLKHGNLVDHSGGAKAVYKDVSLFFGDVLIDSAAENDRSRFLFAKTMHLKASDIQAPLGNTNYDLGIGSISISGNSRKASIQNLSIKPHGGRQAFVSKLKYSHVV
jgi:hypothetical protein